MTNVLIVDAERVIRSTLKERLEYEGYVVDTAQSRSEATGKLERSAFDVMLCDISLPEKDALDLLSVAHDSCPDLPVIMLSKLKGLDVAIDCIRRGAYDYIEKPIDLNKLLNSIRDSLQVKSQNRATKQSSGPEVNTGNKPAVAAGDDAQFQRAVRQRVQPSQSDAMVGTSKGMVHVKSLIDKVALSDARVLVLGANGTGKELVAHALHDQSRRAGGPFIEVNCAAIPSELIESELFGHEKGAFTSAIKQRKGKFEQADGGTLFLDEISSMPLILQGKLLRVLQEREIRRVGGTKSIPVDVRVIAASNANLEEAVVKGAFRSDLFYRFAVITIDIPPLRKRPEDILPLARHFIAAEVGTGRPAPVVGAAAANVLLAYDWPGNVRELENCVKHALTFWQGGEITPHELPARIVEHQPSAEALGAGVAANASLKTFLKQKEKEYIGQILNASGGDKEKAAETLKVNLSTLYRKLSEER